MILLSSAALALLALLAIPLVLHLVRPRSRTVRTTTLVFFAALHRTTRDAPWLRHLKRLLALLMSLLVVTLVVLALARPVLAPPADAARSVVVLVDRSASMAAGDATGHSRLDAAVEAASARIAALPAGTAVAVVTHDVRADIICAPTLDHGAATRALAAVTVRPVAGDQAAHRAALDLAGRLAASAVPAQVWELSDHPLAVATLPADVTHRPLSVALSQPVNAGITAADVRRRPLNPDQLDVFVGVDAVLSPGTRADAELAIAIDGVPVALRMLACVAGEDGMCPSQRVSFPLDRPRGERLSVTLRLPGDMLVADNQVELHLPRQERVRVALVGTRPDPFLTLVLTGLAQAGSISLDTIAPTAWSATIPADVVVFAGWLPPTWTPRPALVIDPPANVAPVRAVAIDGGLPVESPRLADAGHPVLHGVASTRVTALQTAVLPSDNGQSPLWSSPAGPFLTAGEYHGERLVVLALAADHSERLALTSVWPLLLGNALNWTTQPARDRQGDGGRRTGTMLTLTGHELVWSDGTRRALTGSTVELDRCGIWSTDAGERGSAALLATDETRLPRADAVQATTVGTTGWQGDLVPLLIAGLLGLLLLESWLNHRRGVA